MLQIETCRNKNSAKKKVDFEKVMTFKGTLLKYLRTLKTLKISKMLSHPCKKNV